MVSWRIRILPLDVLVSLAALSLVATEHNKNHVPQHRRHKYEHREPEYVGPMYKRPPIKDSVYLTRNQTTVNVRMGHTAHLPCVVQHLGTKQVSWYRQHEEHILTIGDMTWVRNSNIIVDYREFDNDVTHWNLSISKAQPEDEGTYICEIIDKKKQILHVRLRVLDPPDYRPEIQIYGKEYVDLGEEVRLICNATGGDLIPEDIDWFKDGDIVDSTRFRNVIITKYRSLKDQALVSELIIDRSRGEDSGTYICRSSENLIDSMEVTVLVEPTANSSNVKRGSGSGSQHARSEHPFNKAALHLSSSLNMATIVAIATIGFLQLWNS
ncbi:zwei Ig domain protein zig-8-like isoform X1 [Haliotis rubra]|uniref:zwei Ig domain protein zig-8-like isoform X1 n=1 Tax=Haliotis rubra TaxID=36100 RepID=UPI001EE4F316|nr:zwei Ig domain protein zig-8-like isoform X1 [Haliotis rubra]XP_046576649.1 zwei Ig domain protein zig-8-like isoform X1 [Haliotis rubra]XP_046576650.1 zwei Ig domain protein zig-8-like isoform X1 [Haliotis rubra]XP_046576651.1 zwei Ig domain protein zig-8-like isoform X1 [Haliotis rubra]XP_046576652.1 zwei Ig domain protein zig-8-like isoform X1 [Haliotis rubra]